MKTQKPPRKRSKGRTRKPLFLFFAGAFFILSFLAFSLVLTHDLSPALDDALFYRAGADTVTRLYYSENGDAAGAFREWEEERVYAGERCLHATLDEMPPHLKDAFVAMEDHRFYRHNGVDALRTAKAALNRLFLGKKSFGGSTITQQLIKNIGGEREKTITRKIREMTRACALEMRHGKDEILAAYLNIVPMGSGCIGVGAAAEAYFGKHVSELTVAEAASLAAIAPAPARLNPRASTEANLARRNRVLARMAELGYLSEEERALAEREPLLLKKEEKEGESVRSWYAERVLFEVKEGLVAKGYTENAADALLYSGGLRIYTALDMRAQRAAEAAFGNPAVRARYGEDFHAGGVLFSPATGKLVALVGDLGEKTSARLYSYATDMRRAPGSTLKPIALYAPAIDEGVITEATLFDDVPQSFTAKGIWPHNSPDVFDGLILAKDALIKSKNTVAVALYRRLGAEHIYASLRDRFGITGLVRRMTDAGGQVRTDLAEAPLALGELTTGVDLFRITRAYLPFCREGSMSQGGTVFRVEDAEGNTLLDFEEEARKVISSATAAVMTHMLTGVVEEGSAKTLTLPTLVETAGKTGTSGDNRDRWFIGYTPYYLCGVWCGYATGRQAVEGTPHLSLFDETMKALHQELPEDGGRSFPKDPSLVMVKVCADSGKMQTILCKEDARGERTTTVLVPASLSLANCDTHVSVFYDKENAGVAYPPRKGNEGKLIRVSLLDIPWRAFPREVIITDAEYVYRDPGGCAVKEGNYPFFYAALPHGVYIGKSHNGRPYHAAARTPVMPPVIEEEKNGTQENTPKTGKHRAADKRGERAKGRAPLFKFRRPFRFPFLGFCV